MTTNNKPISKRKSIASVKSTSARWNIQCGRLTTTSGRPGKTPRLFTVLGEKLPYDALPAVRKHLAEQGHTRQGVYVAQDSMACARYIGRGDIFQRLSARKREQQLELEYFSFYVIPDKIHEREIETLLIRAAGFPSRVQHPKEAGWH